MEHIDILIIGGGASGLAAAITAKICAPSFSVLILERNRRVGRKLLITGNGRCNLGNRDLSERFYHGSIKALLPQILKHTLRTEEFFGKLGLYCRAESAGRLYPYGNQASAILDALRLSAENLGIVMHCGSFVRSIIKREDELFEIGTNDRRTFVSKALLLATGGYAAPKTGSDGNIFPLLQIFGHRCVNIKPALVPFWVAPGALRGMKGVRVMGRVSAQSEKGRVLAQESGEVQCNETSLSGICVMNLSAQCVKEEPASISLDLLPEQKEAQTLSLLWKLYAIRGDWALTDWLTGLFPKNLCLPLLYYSGIAANPESPVYNLTDEDLARVAHACHNWLFPVIKRGSWQDAQVTCGGIPFEEVTDKLESKLVPLLFFAGEILDIHGDCGGYNLEWAWHSGQYAGLQMVNALSKDT